MIKEFFRKFKIIFKDRKIRGKILFLGIIFALFRLLSAVPVPGVDQDRLRGFLEGNNFFGLLNIFSGGGLSNLSIVMLGVGPYITASIVMQLLTMMIPKLKEMYHEEGQAGKMKFMQYSRLLTVPLAIVQGLGFLLLLQNQGILPALGPADLILGVIVITAGSMLLTWLGELISEFGIGNGVSMIIFAGIVAGIPFALGQSLFVFELADLPKYIGFIAVALIIIMGVVTITEAERPVPITYAKQVRGNRVYGGVSTYLPLRINQAGVIPIIFALSILLLPQMLFSLLTTIGNSAISGFANQAMGFLSNNVFHGIAYFVLVFLFTYFYTAVTFDPDSIAKNLQKSGAFIPGVRPGESTAKYLSRVITRTTFVGALFLGLIAVLPVILQGVFGIPQLTIGGTALLIVVSVLIDLFKKVDAQISMREY